MAVNLVALKSVIIVRDGKRVSPPVGKSFPFTTEERDNMREDVDYRKAINEDEEADLAEIKAERNSPHVSKPKTNAKGAGNTTAMEGGADGTGTTEGEDGQDADSNKAGRGKAPAKAKATTGDDDL